MLVDEKQQLIRSLLQIAVELKPQQPFKFSSGILSPIYCDNRRLISHPHVRDQIITSFIEHIASLETIDIVAGTATVTRADETFELCKNESTFIPIGTKHRLQNLTDEILEIVEVQSGEYLGEDDIVRYEDAYARQ